MGRKGKDVHLLMFYKKQIFNPKRIAYLSEERSSRELVTA